MSVHDQEESSLHRIEISRSTTHFQTFEVCAIMLHYTQCSANKPNAELAVPSLLLWPVNHMVPVIHQTPKLPTSFFV